MAAEASGARPTPTRPVWRCAGTEGASFATVLLKAWYASPRQDSRTRIGANRQRRARGGDARGPPSAGVTRQEIASRLQSGGLLRVHRGVYRVGHRAPSLDATYLAAVLAAGEGTLLSGRAAAHLFVLTKSTAPPPEVIARTQRRIEGVTTHRSHSLNARDATTFRGIPVTTVPRTLADLAGELSPDALARACHEAGVRYGTTPKAVEAVLARRPSTPGAKKLRRVLHGDVHVTLSTLEARFLELLSENGLAPPITGWTGLWLFPGGILIIPAIIWFVKVQGSLNRYWAGATASAGY